MFQGWARIFFSFSSISRPRHCVSKLSQDIFLFFVYLSAKKLCIRVESGYFSLFLLSLIQEIVLKGWTRIFFSFSSIFQPRNCVSGLNQDIFLFFFYLSAKKLGFRSEPEYFSLFLLSLSQENVFQYWTRIFFSFSSISLPRKCVSILNKDIFLFFFYLSAKTLCFKAETGYFSLFLLFLSQEIVFQGWARIFSPSFLSFSKDIVFQVRARIFFSIGWRQL